MLLMPLLGGRDTQTLALLPGLKFVPLLLCRPPHASRVMSETRHCMDKNSDFGKWSW